MGRRQSDGEAQGFHWIEDASSRKVFDRRSLYIETNGTLVGLFQFDRLKGRSSPKPRPFQKIA